MKKNQLILTARSTGILAVGGLVSFMFCGFFLINQNHLDLSVTIDVLIISGATFGGLIAGTTALILRSRKSPIVNSIIGHEGIITTAINPIGEVEVKGEMWRASAEENIAINHKIIVIGQSDITLHVEEKRD